MPQALHKFHFDSNRDRGGKREGERGGKERDRCLCGGGKMEQKPGGSNHRGGVPPLFLLVVACPDL